MYTSSQNLPSNLSICTSYINAFNYSSVPLVHLPVDRVGRSLFSQQSLAKKVSIWTSCITGTWWKFRGENDKNPWHCLETPKKKHVPAAWTFFAFSQKNRLEQKWTRNCLLDIFPALSMSCKKKYSIGFLWFPKKVFFGFDLSAIL